MRSWFGNTGRADDQLLAEQHAAVSDDDVARAMLEKVPGLVGVLNDKRQLVGANRALLHACGVGALEEWLGARPGELFGCVHSHEVPGGCGEAEWCSTCGAAIAIVSSLCWDAGVERTCVVTTQVDGQIRKRHLCVRAEPYSIGGQHYVLLFIREEG